MWHALQIHIAGLHKYIVSMAHTTYLCRYHDMSCVYGTTHHMPTWTACTYHVCRRHIMRTHTDTMHTSCCRVHNTCLHRQHTYIIVYEVCITYLCRQHACTMCVAHAYTDIHCKTYLYIDMRHMYVDTCLYTHAHAQDVLVIQAELWTLSKKHSWWGEHVYGKSTPYISSHQSRSAGTQSKRTVNWTKALTEVTTWMTTHLDLPWRHCIFKDSSIGWKLWLQLWLELHPGVTLTCEHWKGFENNLSEQEGGFCL